MLRLHCIAASAALVASIVSAHDRHATAAMHQDVRVLVERHSVSVSFTVETNEEGRIIEAIAMDSDSDGRITREEQAGYFARLDAQLREGLQVTVAGYDVRLSPSSSVELSPPARKTFIFRSDHTLPAAATRQVEVHNDNFLDWPGRAALHVETGPGLDMQMDQSSGTDAKGILTLAGMPGSKAAPAPVNSVPWSDWSWQARLRPRFGMVALVLSLMASGLMLALHRRRSRWFRISGWLVAGGCLSASALLPWRRAPDTVPAEAWVQEFHRFHDDLLSALARYHKEGHQPGLSSFGPESASHRLASATRISVPLDERSGTLELRRVRPLVTTLLEAPQDNSGSTLRVHHEWRAIGLMRHLGHPHERVRDFSCDYTLRVTDHGFQLLDCSDWHQLPDEPLE